MKRTALITLAAVLALGVLGSGCVYLSRALGLVGSAAVGTLPGAWGGSSNQPATIPKLVIRL